MSYPGDRTLTEVMCMALEGTLGEPPDPFDLPAATVRMLRSMHSGRQLFTCNPATRADYVDVALEGGLITRVWTTTWGDELYALTPAGQKLASYLGGPPLPIPSRSHSTPAARRYHRTRP